MLHMPCHLSRVLLHRPCSLYAFQFHQHPGLLQLSSGPNFNFNAASTNITNIQDLADAASRAACSST